jgi:hypothetical protein
MKFIISYVIPCPRENNVKYVKHVRTSVRVFVLLLYKMFIPSPECYMSRLPHQLDIRPNPSLRSKYSPQHAALCVFKIVTWFYLKLYLITIIALGCFPKDYNLV